MSSPPSSVNNIIHNSNGVNNTVINTINVDDSPDPDLDAVNQKNSKKKKKKPPINNNQQKKNSCSKHFAAKVVLLKF
jgi:hypothetical protein